MKRRKIERDREEKKTLKCKSLGDPEAVEECDECESKMCTMKLKNVWVMVFVLFCSSFSKVVILRMAVNSISFYRYDISNQWKVRWIIYVNKNPLHIPFIRDNKHKTMG